MYVLAFVFLVGTTNAYAYTQTTTLRLGSRGPQVMELQRTLNQHGFVLASVGSGSPGFETTYFGPLTRAAVIRFQIANTLTPDGIVGPITGGRLSTLTTTLPAGCSSNTGYSPTTGQPCNSASSVAGCLPGYAYSPISGKACNGTSSDNGGSVVLSGSNGTISDVTKLSQYNNEEVGEGEKAVVVAGFEVKASNDGDIQLRSIKLSFDSTGNTGSTNLDDYIKSVTIRMGDTKVGSAAVSDFVKDSGVWSKTITLSNAAVIRSDKAQRFYILVDAANNLDSADISGDSWTVDVDNIRYIDGSSVTSTDTTTGDINAMNVPINFVSYSTAVDTELKISSATDSPRAGIVVIDQNNVTDNVLLLKGKIKAEGRSDVTIDQLPVTLTTAGGANVSAVTNSLTLKIGNQSFGETVAITGSTTGTVTFDNLGFTIGAGETVDFEIRADINDIDPGTLDEGDTLTASITATNRDYIDAENQQGDQLSDATEKSGTAIGEAQELRTNGIAVALISDSASVTSGSGSNDDLGTFRIRFRVTAVGSDIYMASAVANAVTYTVDRAGTTTSGGVSATLTNLTDTTLTPSVGDYLIQEGTSQVFELTVTAQLPAAGTAGLYRASLTGVKWDIDDDPTPDNTYTSNLDQFSTEYIGLN